MSASKGRVIYRCDKPSFKQSDRKFKCNKCKSDKCKCGFKRSKLFCTTDNGTQNIDVLPGVDFWQHVASLKVCQEDCSEVLHKVSGVVSASASSGGAPTLNTIILDLTFRIIDEFGKEVCRRDFNFAQDVTPPIETRVTLDFPFCFNCCDRPRQCDSKTIYRLQVSGEIARLSFVRDVSWEAIVWESC